MSINVNLKTVSPESSWDLIRLKSTLHNKIIEIGKIYENNYEKNNINQINQIKNKEKEFLTYECTKRCEFVIYEENIKEKQKTENLRKELLKKNLEEIENLRLHLEEGSKIMIKHTKQKYVLETENLVKKIIEKTRKDEELQCKREMKRSLTEHSNSMLVLIEDAVEVQLKNDLELITRLWCYCKENIKIQKASLLCRAVTETMHAICAEKAISLKKLHDIRVECQKNIEDIQKKIKEMIDWRPHLQDCPNVEIWKRKCLSIFNQFQKFIQYTSELIPGHEKCIDNIQELLQDKVPSFKHNNNEDEIELNSIDSISCNMCGSSLFLSCNEFLPCCKGNCFILQDDGELVSYIASTSNDQLTICSRQSKIFNENNFPSDSFLGMDWTKIEESDENHENNVWLNSFDKIFNDQVMINHSDSYYDDFKSVSSTSNDVNSENNDQSDLSSFTDLPDEINTMIDVNNIIDNIWYNVDENALILSAEQIEIINEKIRQTIFDEFNLIYSSKELLEVLEKMLEPAYKKMKSLLIKRRLSHLSYTKDSLQLLRSRRNSLDEKNDIKFLLKHKKNSSISLLFNNKTNFMQKLTIEEYIKSRKQTTPSYFYPSNKDNQLFDYKQITDDEWNEIFKIVKIQKKSLNDTSTIFSNQNKRTSILKQRSLSINNLSNDPEYIKSLRFISILEFLQNDEDIKHLLLMSRCNK